MYMRTLALGLFLSPTFWADMSTCAISMTGWTYGGTASSPTVKENPHNASVTYTYYNSSYTSLGSNRPSNAGTYYVKAEVRSIDSYSAHADYEELIRFLECQDKEKIKKLKNNSLLIQPKGVLYYVIKFRKLRILIKKRHINRKNI